MGVSKEERLLHSVGVLLNLFTVNEDRFPSAEGRMRYNPIDFQSLRYIADHPGCQGADIARALGVAPTTLQSALDRMIRKGLIERTDHPTSRRAKSHSLTEEGKAIRAAILRQDLSNMRDILNVLSPEEQVIVVDLMEKVVGRLAGDD